MRTNKLLLTKEAARILSIQKVNVRNIMRDKILPFVVTISQIALACGALLFVFKYFISE